ncbi:TetR/AcrR family transcriptional regulator [Pseudotabrizicola sp. 4114]|uniref:TetR/AcrR family transcriptional regulator n=1 Tax=Pseudotabrizicola sp. 4114 TaxID=2817731 RepID=UPI002855843E|nr:AcrR family transcriptional regulator [Pseudorhodobacter sp. 4114]
MDQNQVDHARTTDPSGLAPDAQAPRTTREDWLRLALEYLVDDGIDRVKIQIIASRLGVSRSGFYWFFKSSQDLHDQMLEYWLHRNTGPIIERAMRPCATISLGILAVFECWVDGTLFDSRLDIAVRLWGRRSKKVSAIVAHADHQRLEALSHMFLRHGYAEEDAKIRARVLYFTQIGHFTLDFPEDMKTRISHVPTYIHAFCGRDATHEEFEMFKAFARKHHAEV